MRKSVQIIGTTLGAAAIIGVTGAAASADDGYDHHGYGDRYGSDHHGYGGDDWGDHGYGGHYGSDHHGYGGDDWGDHGYGDHRDGDHGYGDDQGDGDQGDSDQGDGSSSYDTQSDSTDHSWWGSEHYAHHGDVTPYGGYRSGATDTTDVHRGFGNPADRTATFDQRKAAVVSVLQNADARLAALQDRLSSEAADDPSGFAPKALTWVTQARAHVERLLSQVQSATTDQQLAEILHQAPSTWTSAA